MSYDFSTSPSACDHLVARERMGITLDRRGLYSLENPSHRIRRPINGISTVKLFVDGKEVDRDHPTLGWFVEADPFGKAGESWQRIRFRRPVATVNWIIEISYVTVAAYCSKCSGTKLVSDFQTGKDGRWRRVTGKAKLIQRCVKLIMTSVCPFYPALSCGLRNAIAKKTSQFSTEEAVSEIQAVMSSLKSIQAVQAKYQALDAGEILRGVGQVSAARDTEDPRVMGVSVTIVSYGGSDQVDLGFTTTRKS